MKIKRHPRILEKRIAELKGTLAKEKEVSSVAGELSGRLLAKNTKLELRIEELEETIGRYKDYADEQATNINKDYDTILDQEDSAVELRDLVDRLGKAANEMARLVISDLDVNDMKISKPTRDMAWDLLDKVLPEWREVMGYDASSQMEETPRHAE